MAPRWRVSGYFDARLIVIPPKGGMTMTVNDLVGENATHPEERALACVSKDPIRHKGNLS